MRGTKGTWRVDDIWVKPNKTEPWYNRITHYNITPYIVVTINGTTLLWIRDGSKR